uniref:Uncharacterized protein n=1 Tax=Arundo donax TaxID=35708 RepID=A0A0A8XT43_ARUDO
MRNLLLLLL